MNILNRASCACLKYEIYSFPNIIQSRKLVFLIQSDIEFGVWVIRLVGVDVVYERHTFCRNLGRLCERQYI